MFGKGPGPNATLALIFSLVLGAIATVGLFEGDGEQVS